MGRLLNSSIVPDSHLAVRILTWSAYGVVKEVCAAVLNMGTSSQLSFEMPEGFEPPLIFESPPKPIQYFPYLGVKTCPGYHFQFSLGKSAYPHSI